MNFVHTISFMDKDQEISYISASSVAFIGDIGIQSYRNVESVIRPCAETPNSPKRC